MKEKTGRGYNKDKERRCNNNKWLEQLKTKYGGTNKKQNKLHMNSKSKQFKQSIKKKEEKYTKNSISKLRSKCFRKNSNIA